MLSTVDPYFTIDGISRSIDFYYRTSRPINSQGEEYKLVTPGVALRFGVPFSEYDTVFFGIGAESTEIKGATVAEQLLPLPRAVRRQEQLAPADDRLDTRQPRQRARAHGGRYMRVNLDYAPLGDAKYFRANLQGQQYIAITRAFTYGVNASSATARAWTASPTRSSRTSMAAAWEWCAASSRDRSGRSTSRVFIRQPPPQHQQRALRAGAGANIDRTLRLFLYADVGNVWGEDESLTFDSLRASAGGGQLDLAGGPTEAQLRGADPEEAGR